MIKHVKKFVIIVSVLLVFLVTLIYVKTKNEIKEKLFPETIIVSNFTNYQIDTLTKLIIHNTLGYDTMFIEYHYMFNELYDGEYMLKGFIVKNIYKNKSYIIFVTRYLREIEEISFLTHELSHLDQFEKGELVQQGIYATFIIYKGDTINFFRTPYHLRQYEIDAHNRENTLFLDLKKSIYK